MKIRKKLFICVVLGLAFLCCFGIIKKNIKIQEINLIIPEYLILPNIGDTYQIEPEAIGVEDPVYSYRSEMPDVISVDENGLITIKGNTMGKIYVIVTEEKTGRQFVKEILVAAVTPVEKEQN